MKKSLLILMMLGATACASVKLVAPTQPDADRASAIFPGTTVAMLDEGKMLMETNCKKCHGIPKPQKETEAEWRKIIPKMAKKARLDAQKEDLILRYVITMGSVPARK